MHLFSLKIHIVQQKARNATYSVSGLMGQSGGTMGAPPMSGKPLLWALFRSWVTGEVFFAHMNARNVRVYLRRSNVGMAKNLLNGA